MEELARVGTRGESEHFISEPPTGAAMIYDSPRLPQKYIPAGIVRNVDPAADSGPQPTVEIEFRNPVNRGEVLEFLGRGLDTFSFTVQGLRNPDGAPVERANPGDRLQVVVTPPNCDWQINGLVRKTSA